MPRGLSKDELKAEWMALPKDWYSIYQWKPTSRAGYLDWIAGWIIESFPAIQLKTEGLRTRSFKAADHRGQISLATGIEQVTEKRIVRALFNRRELPVLGQVLDYEVPLKDRDDAAHGDIDLLCLTPTTCFCLEAKKPDSSESILKPILQAFVYTMLASTKKREFLSSFGLEFALKLTPGVVTFSTAQSGRQLGDIATLQMLRTLIRSLNERLHSADIMPMRFFVIDNSPDDIAAALTATTEANGDVKAVLAESLSLEIAEKILV